MIRTIKLPKLLIFVAFLLNLGRAAIQLIIPEKVAGITSINLGDGNEAINLAVATCITLFLLAIAEFVGGLVSTYITLVARALISRDFRKVVTKKAFLLKVKDIEAQNPKEFISRITADTEFVGEFLIDLLVNEIPRLYFVISTIIRVSRMGNVYLVLGFVLVIPVIVIGSLWSGSVSYNALNKLQASIARLTAILAEKVNNIETIKAYNKTEDEVSSGNTAIDEMRSAQRKNTWAVAFNTLISNILYIIPMVIIMLTGATQLLNGSITREHFITYFGLAITYQTYIAAHLTLWVLWKRAQGATGRVHQILELKDDCDGESKGFKDDRIEFKNISFSYGNRTILSDVSFAIEKGSKTAIVGKSGSGKSTILNLLERFYRPEKGSIYLGGRNIEEYEIGSYRSNCAYLPQNAPGFSGNIRDMLTYGMGEHFSDDKLYELLDKVGMKEPTRHMGGLDYEVGTNAVKLSGGQRQRLAVARMLLKNSEIVLADECTSALDLAGSLEIAALIDEYASDKTRIMVAHNLATVKDADRIIVIDSGKILDMGTHEELKNRCVVYQNLLNGEEGDAS